MLYASFVGGRFTLPNRYLILPKPLLSRFSIKKSESESESDMSSRRHPFKGPNISSHLAGSSSSYGSIKMLIITSRTQKAWE